MNGNMYMAGAYIVGLGLLATYAVSLWRASCKMAQRVQIDSDRGERGAAS